MSRSQRELSSVEVADRLHSAAIHLLRRLRVRDQESGIGPAQMSALSVLVFGGPRSLKELAAAEQVKPPTMSRIVAGLARAGLARVDSDAQDARRIRVSATAKGERLLQQARERRIQAVAELLDRLSGRDLAVLRDAAQVLERAIQSASQKR